jgi:hypothetical protein
MTPLKKRLADACKVAHLNGLKLAVHNPGDGIKVRFYLRDDPSDFFGPNNPLDSLYGKSNAETLRLVDAWLAGFMQARTML